MPFRHGLALVAIVGAVLSWSTASAKDKTPRRFEPKIALETDRNAKPPTGNIYDCYQKTKRFGGLLRGLQSSDEAKHRKLTVRAAREALERGYNYIVLGPMLETVDQFDTARTRWETVGVGYGFDMFGGYVSTVSAPVTRRNVTRNGYYYLDCRGVDDVDAYAIMWDAHTTYSLGVGESLVDIRSLLVALGPAVEGSRYSAPPPAQPKVTPNHFKYPGDRERISLQLSTMRRAADCRRANTTLNDALLTQQSAAQQAAIRSCLEPLRADAEAVGWLTFPLFSSENRTAVAVRGFSLNATADPSFGTTAPSGPSSSGRTPAPARYGSSEWELTPNQPPGFDGIALFQTKPADTPRSQILLASNTLSRAELLNHAVFHLSHEMLGQRQNGIVATDKTDDMRRRFDRYRANVEQRLESDRERATMEQAHHEAALRDYESARAQYESYRREYPGQVKQSFEAMAGPPPTAPVVQATGESRRASDAVERDDYKGPFRAFEEYSNVVYLWSYNPPYCSAKYVFCADKLEAYNTLGPQIMGPGFQPLSTPSGYTPFDAAVR